MTSHTLGGLAGSRQIMLHMQLQAVSRPHGRHLECMTSHQKSDSVNQCALLEEQSFQISLRTDLMEP